jgi:hypothetical protein
VARAHAPELAAAPSDYRSNTASGPPPTPGRQQHYLNSLCHSWMNVSITASMGADQLTQAIGAITNHQQADW